MRRLEGRNLDALYLRYLAEVEDSRDSRAILKLAVKLFSTLQSRFSQRLKAYYHNGTLVGVAAYNIGVRKPELTILALAVLGKHRNRGYGTEMLTNLIEIGSAEGMQFVKLEAASKAAKNWYINRGFVFTSAEKPMRSHQPINNRKTSQMTTTDYRPHPTRVTYCEELYRVNLEHGIMPGLVYLYMPALKQTLNWSEERALWFAFLNGMTQNPLTSLLLMEQLPDVPDPGHPLTAFDIWFNREWPRLFFDTDRLKNKRNTIPAIKSYAKLVGEYGSQQLMLDNRTYPELWDIVSNGYYSFGRLSTFSYLEYVRIMGHGSICTDLMVSDKGGSKSHRNGLLFLSGLDHMVNDPRAKNGFDGNYPDYDKMCGWLTEQANEFLRRFAANYTYEHTGYFTFESQLCQFKNNFFGRRYPGCYSDMAFDRLLKHEDAWGKDRATKLIWDIRTSLPDWLRNEAKNDKLSIPDRAKIFPKTGFPYRGEYFL